MSFRDWLHETRAGASAGLRIGLPILLLILAALWITWRFVEPAPPKRVVIAAGLPGGAYERFAKQYAEHFRKNGFDLVVKPTAGTLENYRLLLDRNSGVDVAIVQGGCDPESAGQSISALCSIYLEPVWVFYRGSSTVSFLSELEGRRIAIGPEGSGVRALARQLLLANGIDPANAGRTQLLDLTGAEAADALFAGNIDAAMMVTSADHPAVRKLLADPNIHLVDIRQADAYQKRFSFLSKVILYQGAQDLGRNLPAKDVNLLGATALLVARDNIHHGTIELLVQAAKAAHSQGTLISSPGDFPAAPHSSLPPNKDAIYYLNAKPLPVLGALPFWLKSLIDRLALLLIPLIALILPLMRFAPALFRWSVRSRITRQYARLRAVSEHLEAPVRATLESDLAMLDKLEHKLATMAVPGGFMPDLYDLRMHTGRVRDQLLKQLAEMK